MTVDSEKDIEGLKRAGRVVSLTLKEMAAQVKPGITTQALDEICGFILQKLFAL